MTSKVININKYEDMMQVAYSISDQANNEINDITALSKLIHKKLRKVFEVKSMYVALYDKGKNSISFPYIVDEMHPGKQGDNVRNFNNGVTEYMINQKKPMLLNSSQLQVLEKDGKISFKSPVPKHWMGAPLMKNSDCIGLIAVKSYSTSNTYNNKDLELLNFVSGQICNTLNRRVTYNEIKRSNEYYKTLAENAVSMITVLDVNGKLNYESPSVKNILGYKKGELEAKKLKKLIHPDDFMKVARYFLQSVKEGKNQTKTVSYRFRHKNGTYIYLESVIEDYQDDQLIDGILINSQNISMRIAAEDKLKLSRDILQRIGTLVIVADSGGNVTYVGSSVKRILGYEPEELVGNGWWIHTYDNKTNGDKKKTKVIAFAKGDTPMDDRPYERKVKCKDGSFRWILWQDTKGPDDLIIGVGNDITKQKNAMKATLNSEEKLKIKNKELDTFVYKASHDLKGPLASTLGLVNVMKQEVKDSLSLKYIDLIKESTIRLDSILMDLLQVTRLKQGALEINPIDFDHLINEVIKSLKHDPDYQTVHVRLFVEQLNKFYSDRKLITSVLQNLIDNAIKYRSLEQRFPYIYISVTSQQAGTKIRIIDNGQGIPKHLQNKVFEMFFRGHEKSQGTGLGLYIVNNTIEKLGGKIEMESEKNKGTHFNIFLPNKTPPKERMDKLPIFVKVNKQS